MVTWSTRGAVGLFANGVVTLFSESYSPLFVGLFTTLCSIAVTLCFGTTSERGSLRMNARKCISSFFIMTCLVPADQLSVARLVLSFSKSSQTWDIGKYEGAKQC